MIQTLLFGGLLFLASFYDWKEGRIPNLLCAFGIGLGIIFCLSDRACFADRWWIPAVLSMFFLFLLWMLRVIGGGDVKLLWMSVLYVREMTVLFFVLSAVYSAMFGVVKLLARGTLYKRFRILFSYVSDCVRSGRVSRYPAICESDRKESGIPVSYGVSAAYVTYVVLHFLTGR